MQTGDISIQINDQLSPAYLATPASGSGPGVLVLHAWWGLNPFFKSFCDRLAGQGFVTQAPDLYNGKVAQTIPEAQLLMAQTDFTQAQAAVVGSLFYLDGLPAVTGKGLAAVGFSMGAAWALWLSTFAPQEVAAVAAFYGTDELDPSSARAAYQGHYAASDPYEPLEGVRRLEDTLKKAGLETKFFVYPQAGHWFMEDDRLDAYDPAAARLAWGRLVEFLKEKLP
ncbi:MAG: dienelactone hydrolase family protein [Anaerolineaceae bacterium]|jgi:carboxymethylenebutenolidase